MEMKLRLGITVLTLYTVLAIGSESLYSGSMEYPFGSSKGIASSFGPRSVSSSWFHTGIDISRTGTDGSGYVPTGYDVAIKMEAKCTHKGATSITFQNQTGNGPEYFRYYHVIPLSSIQVGTTYPANTHVADIQYLSGGNHVHLETWEWNRYDASFNSTSFSSSRLHTTNPLKWLPFYYEDTWSEQDRYTLDISPVQGETWNSETIDGQTRKYVSLDFQNNRTDYTVNRIDLKLHGPEWYKTSDWLFNPASLIGTGYDQGTGIVFATSNKTYPRDPHNAINLFREPSSVTNTIVATNGIKMQPYSMSTGGQKKYVSKFFINEKDGQVPFFADVCLSDCRGTSVICRANVDLASCVGCTGPNPPSTVNATANARGMSLSWTDMGQQAYVVYRRSSSTSGIREAIPVGITDENSFVDEFAYSGLRPYSSYKYSVACIDNNGQEGENSAEKQASTTTPPYWEDFLYHPMDGGFYSPTSWGYDYNNFCVPRVDDGTADYPYLSTYLSVESSGNAFAMKSLPSDCDRTINKIVIVCRVRWSDLIGPYLSSGNRLYIDLYDANDDAVYSIRYTPTGTLDGVGGTDVVLEKYWGSEILGTYATNAVTNTEWMEFTFILNRTQGTGADSKVYGFVDLQDGKGKRMCFVVQDSDFERIEKLGFWVDSSSDLVKFDDIKVMTAY